LAADKRTGNGHCNGVSYNNNNNPEEQQQQEQQQQQQQHQRQAASLQLAGLTETTKLLQKPEGAGRPNSFSGSTNGQHSSVRLRPS